MLGCLLEMKQANYGRDETRVEIKDPEQARLLSDPENFRYFEPFLARDCTVSRAAKELNIKVDTMLYRVKTFLNAKLLKVVRLEPRRGRSIKHYRSSADAYYVPFEVTPFEDVEAFFRRSRKANEEILIPRFAKIIRQIGREGRQIFRDDKGEVWSSSAGNVNDTFTSLENTKAVEKILRQKQFIAENSNDILQLTDQEARDFVVELYKVWGKYKRGDKSKRNPYFFEFSFVPMDD
jgi:hypothetical protein